MLIPLFWRNRLPPTPGMRYEVQVCHSSDQADVAVWLYRWDAWKVATLNYGKVDGYHYCLVAEDLKSSGTTGLSSNFNLGVMILVLKITNCNMQLPRAPACTPWTLKCMTSRGSYLTQSLSTLTGDLYIQSQHSLNS